MICHGESKDTSTKFSNNRCLLEAAFDFFERANKNIEIPGGGPDPPRVYQFPWGGMEPNPQKSGRPRPRTRSTSVRGTLFLLLGVVLSALIKI